MKLLLINFSLISLFYLNFCFAQSDLNSTFQYRSNYKSLHANETVFNNSQTSEIKHSFDILDYKLNLDIRSCFISPYPSSFKANIIIKFVADSSITFIKLNAVSSSLLIDSVSLSGISFTSAQNILTINLSRTYNPGDTGQVKIYYRKANTSNNYFIVNSPSLIKGVFTDCEPEGARYWFPCWDSPSDKATWNLTAKVPLNVRFASNGLLNDSTVSGDTIYYHWISRDPMATYLMHITGQVNFNVDKRFWHKTSNPNDSIPVVFYSQPGDTLSYFKSRVLHLTDFFSQKFGDYPFEKIGFSNSSGAMENQSMINIYTWKINGIATHELAHSWFGDLITCATWADVWLNEGFATYSDLLWKQYSISDSTYRTNLNLLGKSYVMNNPGWPMYNPVWNIRTPSNDTLFNSFICYNKGCCVLGMLRHMIGDSLFFGALKSYTTDPAFRFKNVTTAAFISKMNQATGMDLNWFFNQWVYQPNHPKYQNSYTIYQSGSDWKVNFTAKQIQTNPAFFKMPVELRFHFTSGPDSTVRLMNDQNNQLFNFTFSRQPTNVIFDPDSNITLKESSTIGISKIESGVPVKYSLSQNYPNPFNPSTKIEFSIPKTGYVKLRVFDIQGKEVSSLVNEILKPGIYIVDFIPITLSSGMYFYKLESDNFSSVKKMLLLK